MTASAGVAPDVQKSFELEPLKTFRWPHDWIYAEVTHNPGLGLISDVWFGNFGEPEAFRAVLEFIAERLETGHYRLWLADLRFMSQSFAPSGDWLVGELMPRIIDAGLLREAVVLPEARDLPEGYDVFGAASDALRRLTSGRVRGFTDIDHAKRWLLQAELPG